MRGVDLHAGGAAQRRVRLSFRQRIDDVIAGFEAAWAFYGTVFATVISRQHEVDR